LRADPPEAILFAAVFSADEAAIDEAVGRFAQEFGRVLDSSVRYPFDETRYYERSMGCGLRKQLVVVDRLIPQDSLAAVKARTNEMEREIQLSLGSNAVRLVNIDPGMLDDGKAMLASTKNNAHRIYVGGGVFVEPTLYLRSGAWEAWPWTYADYRRPEVHEFFHRARAHYRARAGGRPSAPRSAG
jgi:hypothetical protein